MIHCKLRTCLVISNSMKTVDENIRHYLVFVHFIFYSYQKYKTDTCYCLCCVKCSKSVMLRLTKLI